MGRWLTLFKKECLCAGMRLLHECVLCARRLGGRGYGVAWVRNSARVSRMEFPLLGPGSVCCASSFAAAVLCTMHAQKVFPCSRTVRICERARENFFYK